MLTISPTPPGYSSARGGPYRELSGDQLPRPGECMIHPHWPHSTDTLLGSSNKGCHRVCGTWAILSLVPSCHGHQRGRLSLAEGPQGCIVLAHTSLHVQGAVGEARAALIQSQAGPCRSETQEHAAAVPQLQPSQLGRISTNPRCPHIWLSCSHTYNPSFAGTESAAGD